MKLLNVVHLLLSLIERKHSMVASRVEIFVTAQKLLKELLQTKKVAKRIVKTTDRIDFCHH